MWRDDALYDVVVEISHNDNPPIPGAGSAVFLHIAKPDYAATEGCVALKHADLLEILKDASPETKIVIQA
jgi:L,D-peptidoglycan transpeptidase YkuD (ErfK/YbiS/YcfS/YnhG family)